MATIQDLFEKNRAWADGVRANDGQFFDKLAQQQTPDYLWIGCADSRVPATRIMDLMPGEVFVHRNIANVVVHTDINCLSVMQYAVDALKVGHIIVCGHYSCGGVQAALQNSRFGLIDNWLRHIQDVMRKHADQLDALPDESQRLARLCELNVIEQVANVCQTTIVQDAWDRGQDLTVHGWIYSLADGALQDLEVDVASPDQLEKAHASAVATPA